MLSVFDIYKIGVGPSSSHTNGPMSAGYAFLSVIPEKRWNDVVRVEINLYGSLSLTGKGHMTHIASMKGLLGYQPHTIDSDAAQEFVDRAFNMQELVLGRKTTIVFKPDKDIVYNDNFLPLHENGISFTAFDKSGETIAFETYYSTGGGFIATEKEMQSGNQCERDVDMDFPFKTACQWLQIANEEGMSLSSVVCRNELALRSKEEIDLKCMEIWNVMKLCYQNGLDTEGVLEGGLGLVRRAPMLWKNLTTNDTNDPLDIMDWVNLFAFAVSEENAAGGRLVTSPTNGAAGVIPAVMMYYDKYIKKLDTRQIREFIFVSGAVGVLYKTLASISGAEAGCQAEIGVATSMAAAGLCSLKGGSNEQIQCAAEIGMEHSLGMTCDPVGGLVQVPCIERNAMGAVKAINASRMALKRSGLAHVSLDEVIETMRRTGKDMLSKYRETSTGGLAVCSPGGQKASQGKSVSPASSCCTCASPTSIVGGDSKW